MGTVGAIDLVALKDEITNYVRYKFSSYDTQSRTTETTQTFPVTTSATIFALTNGTLLSYVAFDGVSVNGTVMSYGEHWLPYFRGAYKGKVILNTAVTSGTVTVKYGYTNSGKSNYAYSDYPRLDLGLDQYPRVGFKLFPSSKLLGAGSGGYSLNTSLLVSLKIVGVNTQLIDEAATGLLNSIKVDAKRFYNFCFIRPDSIRDFELNDDTTGKVVSKIIDFVMANRVESINYST